MSRRRKKELCGKIFRITSIIFILFCCVFYGYRLIKYYKIYNAKGPEKSEKLLSIVIPKNSPIVIEGSGLYHIGGSYVYKGEVDNNYLEFSGLLFRIVRINYGATVELVLDDPINTLSWDKDNGNYKNSEINKYLNNNFLKYLNQSKLSKNNVCLDEISDLTLIKNQCEDNSYSNYVKLLDINTFLNTIVDNKSYLTSQDEIFWLSNKGKDSVWHTNGYNVSTSKSTSYYNVKPVITLNMDVELKKGTGTKDDPYKIEKDSKYTLGKYVKLGDDTYRIIGIDDKNLKLILSNSLSKVMSFGPTVEFDIKNSKTLLNYLNTKYYEQLSYKDIILKEKYSYGTYQEALDNKSKTYESHIALPTILDPKLKNDSSMGAYFLANYTKDNKIYTYQDDGLYISNPTLAKQVKPVITIAKKNINKGSGTKEDPYRMEEE